MRFTVALLLGFLGLNRAENVDGELHLLTDYPDALCLDGSPGAYYLSMSSDPQETRWMLYFEGGGWCYSEKDCANRANTDLGSSKAYGSTAGRDGGVSSGNCDVNPTFCDFNYVHMKYCDGNSFSGNRDAPVSVNGQELHFKGHSILEAVLTDLAENHGLKDATEVALTGCSAGGLSTILHSDFVHSWVKDAVPALEKYGAIPISGFFMMNRNNVAEEEVMPEQMATIFELSNATVGVHQGCLESIEAGKEWQCNTAPGVFQSIEAPIFVLDSSIDSWQSGCIMTSQRVDQDQDFVPNGDCGSVPGWESCSTDPNSCDEEQIYGITEYQSAFVRTLTNNNVFKRADSGAFIYECHTHCSGGSDDDYVNFSINGKSMSQAVDEWWSGLDEEATKSYLPQLWTTDGNPNPTC